MDKKVQYTLENVYGRKYNTEQWEAQLQNKNGVPFFTFPSLEQFSFIRQGFSTKLGGCSEGDLYAMNLSYSRGDQPERVDENYRRITNAMGLETRNLVLSDQVHDTKVKLVTKADCQGDNLRDKKLVGIDGLISNEKEVLLCTSYADCVPLYFVDPEHEAIGLSHSGWRGTVGKMAAKTLTAMEKAFATNPKQVYVVIGPSICQACYEVSQDVADAFANFVDSNRIAWLQAEDSACIQNEIKEVLQEKGQGKYQLDLWHANQLICMEAGVPRAQIAVSGVCTCCNHHLLYSHRKTNGKRGNLAAFLQLQ